MGLSRTNSLAMDYFTWTINMPITESTSHTAHRIT